MADNASSKSGLPVTGLVGIVLAAVAVLVNHDTPFLATRPAEPGRPTNYSVAEQRVDARLWQDPFSAVEDFEHREAARLDFDGTARKLSPENARAPAPASARAGFATRRFGITPDEFRLNVAAKVVGASRGLVIPVLIDGSQFVGAEEARRRTRYAVVSALDELDYVPVDSDHIGYVVVPPVDATDNRPPVRVPFEEFQFRARTRPSEGVASTSDSLPTEIVILWVDDSALTASNAGGSWFDEFGNVLVSLNVCRAGAVCPVPVIGPTNSDRFKTLNSAPGPGAGSVRLPWFVSPSVTSEILDDVDVQRAQQLRGIRQIRTISTDAKVLRAVVGELDARGVPLCDDNKRVLVLGEWETTYGRLAPLTLQDALDKHGCPAGRKATRVLAVSFVRGLDGVAVSGKASEPDKPSESPTQSLSGASATQIEWPESADQRDYLRRIGHELEDRRLTQSIVAVGIIASDTHDKLLLLQATRPLLPKAPFFTTDIDARYAHPLVLQWTRNLIIGSSYGLTVRSDVQQRTPPFRDGYQTAMFLAVLAAAELPGCAGECDGLNSLANQSPQLFEVGLNGFVPLLPDSGQSITRPECSAAHLVNCGSAQPIYRPLSRLSVTIGAVTTGFAMAAIVMVAWGWRRETKTNGVESARGTRTASVPKAPKRPQLSSLETVMSRLFLGGLLGSLALAGGLVFQILVPGLRMYPPEPLLLTAGISSWPVACCWALAQCLTFMFLLRVSMTNEARFEATGERFLGHDAFAAPASPESARFWHWLWNIVFTRWAAPPAGSHVRGSAREIWARYRLNATGSRRLIRVGVIWLVLFAIPFALVHGESLLPPPVIRGAFRYVVVFLDLSHTIVLTILMAAVADAALLCSFFVMDLGRQRNTYPPDILEGACSRLGLSAQLKPHLDEYLDTEWVAARTADVASYLYYPFMVLAVLALSMTRIFDDWVFNASRLGLYALYVGILLLLWLGLHGSATRAREASLEEMDLISLRLQAGTGKSQPNADAALKQFETLTDRVRNNSSGAYGPLLGQPIFRALLWPLGGISSAQVIQYFLAR